MTPTLGPSNAYGDPYHSRPVGLRFILVGLNATHNPLGNFGLSDCHPCLYMQESGSQTFASTKHTKASHAWVHSESHVRINERSYG